MFVSILVLYATSIIILANVLRSWLDLKLFVPTSMIKRSGFHFRGGLIYVIISSVVDLLRCFITTFSLSSDNSHPYISLTVESPTIAVTIWSFLRSCFSLLRLICTFFSLEILVLFSLLLLFE